jgi:hypothetical protein
MILSPDGRLIWFYPLAPELEATDVRVQRYGGKPVLTWWQGYLSTGIGIGHDVMVDSSYRQIATVHAADGLSADLHEFQLTPHGTALITSYFPVWWDASSVGGPKRLAVEDSVVQEIDVKTGLLLFQWDSLDHIPLAESYLPLHQNPGTTDDYFHVNSIDLDADGNLLVSARNTWAAYKIDRHTGQILWRLGGKRSSFKMAPGTRFAFQHDVRIRGSNDSVITLFDDGAGPPNVHRQSQGLKLALDFKNMTASQLERLSHSPPLLASFEGNYQQLQLGQVFLGWGQQSYFTQLAAGRSVLDGHFVGINANYRVYRFPWSATPYGRPSIAATTTGQRNTVYASWNGATDVASWRVLAGTSASRLAPVATAGDQGFETAIPIAPKPDVAVQALNSRGRVLGTSATITPR